MTHDQYFKGLLWHFFPDFLRLFVPEIADAIVPDATTLLDPQTVTGLPEGTIRTADVVGRVQSRDGDPETVLVHTEAQSKVGANFEFRMWQYNATLTNRYGPPVISIALLPFASGGIHIARYNETVFGREYARLDYWRIGLRSLHAADYLTAEPILGSILAALMRRETASKVDIRAAAAERVHASGLDPARQTLLIDFMQRYLALSPRESAEYLGRTTREGETMETLELTWSQKKLQEGKAAGIAEGELHARRDVLLDLIRTRFGEAPADLAARIATADTPMLTSLLRMAAVAGSVDELRGP
ncbi:MAG TPA: hypothetical protein VNL71_01805 [Chloroflexota bacterium]|nr:hypothetical protein [Chloroflexota bacterium]